MLIFFDIETISDYRDYDVAKLQEKYEDRLPFYPEYNQILTICVGRQSADGHVVKALEGDERSQITEFLRLAEEWHTFVGFNIRGFDLPFIIKRAIHHGMHIPTELKTWGKKPREIDNIIDLYDVYKLMGYQSAGLGPVCEFLGLKSPKDHDIDGSQVQAYYDAGKTQDIIDYCIRDVHATIDVYKKFKSLGVM